MYADEESFHLIISVFAGSFLAGSRKIESFLKFVQRFKVIFQFFELPENSNKNGVRINLAKIGVILIISHPLVACRKLPPQKELIQRLTFSELCT